MTSPIIYIPHGAGPMPLLDDARHDELISYLGALGSSLKKPKTLLVISAHWEESCATVSSNKAPKLIFDYHGFPEEAYQISYPAAGKPELANNVVELLDRAGINAVADSKRGLDHGSFVPLKLMFPDADIPVVQLSLLRNLDPQEHIRIGEAIASLAHEDILIMGSGFSFHNIQVLMNQNQTAAHESEVFDQWLNQVIMGADKNWLQKEVDLIDWVKAPYAKFAHPRAEHLMPLHVCFGAAKKLNLLAENNFNSVLLGAKTSGFIWQ